jgi:hypothetical protein
VQGANQSITSAPSASTKEEDTVEVDDAPHYLLKGWRGLNLSTLHTHMSFMMCMIASFEEINISNKKRPHFWNMY